MNNVNCPCKRTKCERYGNCKGCCMKFIRYISLFLIIPICLLFTSCHLYSNNENSNKSYNSDEYGKNVLNQIIDTIENKDKDRLVTLFSSEVKNKVSDFKYIDDLFEFYKGIRQNIDYNYSEEVNIFETGKHYSFDECLASVKTTENTYWFEFLLCKNDDSQGIVTLVISTEKSREYPEYSEFIVNVFSEAEYFNKDYFGVLIFSEE